jgi:hypothetical protein
MNAAAVLHIVVIEESNPPLAASRRGLEIRWQADSHVKQTVAEVAAGHDLMFTRPEESALALERVAG